MHIESEFNTATLGKKHTTPTAENDIRQLMEMYIKNRWHKYVPKRCGKNSNDYITDLVAPGALNIVKEDVVNRWTKKWSFEWATAEDWEELWL